LYFGRSRELQNLVPAGSRAVTLIVSVGIILGEIEKVKKGKRIGVKIA
jgi:hypothetical protein